MQNNAGVFLTRHKNTLLLLLLVTTLLLGSTINRSRLEEGQTAVSIPVMKTNNAAATPLEAFRQSREEALLADMAALQALCDQEGLDTQTRSDAAQRLQRIVDQHQAQLAIEGALSTSSLAPCAAVVRTGSVTVVTEKQTITQQDSALVIAVAKEQAGVSSDGVQVITAQ